MIRDLSVLMRSASVFSSDILRYSDALRDQYRGSSLLVLGGGGSIGSRFILELMRFEPRHLTIVELDEHRLVELVRSVRSLIGASDTPKFDFILDDIARDGFVNRFEGTNFDFVFNFAALKHVRSARDIYSVSRMIAVNVLAAFDVANFFGVRGIPCFIVSSDKAVGSANIMGASKALMERAVFGLSSVGDSRVHSARFANVLFSHGSLTAGFIEALKGRRAFSVPIDIKRYFITDEEAAHISLLGTLPVVAGNILVPREGLLDPLSLVDVIAAIAEELQMDLEFFDSEAKCRKAVAKSYAKGRVPTWVFSTDTEGEKQVEEFASRDSRSVERCFETVDLVRPIELGNPYAALQEFQEAMSTCLSREQVVQLLHKLIPDFNPVKSEKILDDKL